MVESLVVSTQQRDSHAVVSPEGDIFFDTIEPPHDALMPLTGADRPRIVRDPAGVADHDHSARITPQ